MGGWNKYGGGGDWKILENVMTKVGQRKFYFYLIS